VLGDWLGRADPHASRLLEAQARNGGTLECSGVGTEVGEHIGARRRLALEQVALGRVLALRGRVVVQPCCRAVLVQGFGGILDLVRRASDL
jgi:hypothetical protein